MSRKTQQGIGARAREHLLGDVCSGFDTSLLASSLQRTFNAAWLEYKSWLQNLRLAGILRPNHGVTNAAATCEFQDQES